MLSAILSLTKQFIPIKSHSDNAKALEEILELALSHLAGFTIERFESHGVKSALVYNTRKRPKKFRLILNGHLDVIPGKERQYIPRIRGRRLYGAGAMDMKANVACMIMAFREVAGSVAYPLGLQLVTDEETGGFHGTKLQIERGVRADFVIAGETTNFRIAHRAKGVLWMEATCKGTAAHGAYPWKGRNAITTMVTFLRNVEGGYPTPKREHSNTTVNVSRIMTSNQSFNKIPDDCRAWLDVRYPPEEDANAIVKCIRALAPAGCRVRLLAKEPPLFADAAHPAIRLLRTVTRRITGKEAVLYGAHGTSDARHFTRVGCPGIEFGPVGGGIGTDQEWVSVPSLAQYCRILKSLLLSLDEVPMQSKKLNKKIDHT